MQRPSRQVQVDDSLNLHPATEKVLIRMNPETLKQKSPPGPQRCSPYTDPHRGCADKEAKTSLEALDSEHIPASKRLSLLRACSCSLHAPRTRCPLCNGASPEKQRRAVTRACHCMIGSKLKRSEFDLCHSIRNHLRPLSLCTNRQDSLGSTLSVSKARAFDPFATSANRRQAANEAVWDDNVPSIPESNFCICKISCLHAMQA